jgi:hypothetical protein
MSSKICATLGDFLKNNISSEAQINKQVFAKSFPLTLFKKGG